MNKNFVNHLQNILNSIKEANKSAVKIISFSNVYGGDINQTFRLELDNSDSLFLKLNSAQKLSMFEAESFALETIYSSRSIKCPRPVTTGAFAGQAYLIMEYIEFGQPDSKSYIEFGRQLANMHKASNDKFGFAIDNTIGSTPQYNSFKTNWQDFWRDNRILPQLKMAENRGAGKNLRLKADRILAKLSDFFPKEPEACLLHGDLWSGNYAADTAGNPVIYDPASYYGDRECDLAMTELFGRCPQNFYDSYNETWPLDEGYARRRTLYNFYHIINHYNLFGGGYASQAERMLDSLL